MPTTLRTGAECKALRSGPRWRWAREAAMERDGHQCRAVHDGVMCGREESWNPFLWLEVHHVEALVHGGEPYDLANLVTVCPPCHRDVAAGRAGFEQGGADG